MIQTANKEYWHHLLLCCVYSLSIHWEATVTHFVRYQCHNISFNRVAQRSLGQLTAVKLTISGSMSRVSFPPPLTPWNIMASYIHILSQSTKLLGKLVSPPAKTMVWIGHQIKCSAFVYERLTKSCVARWVWVETVGGSVEGKVAVPTQRREAAQLSQAEREFSKQLA